MKVKILLCMLMCAFFVNPVHAGFVGPVVNENVEMMAILARLAGFEEYNYDMGGSYTDDIDSYFKDCKEHPAVLKMKDLRANNGVAYDAVMSMAVHLQRQDDGFIIIEQEKPSLEKRWNGVDMENFLSLLGKFYDDSDFREFFDSHNDFYRHGLDAYKENVLKYFDKDWYQEFFGYASDKTYTVVIGFVNGPCSYGANRYEKGHDREIFAVVGYAVFDGKSVFNKSNSSTLIHEFCHSFINVPIKSGEKTAGCQTDVDLFRSVKRSMTSQAYPDWQIVVNESVVRAATICYMLDHGYTQDEVINELLKQMDRNFRWMPDLVSLLRKYEKKRNRYPDFMSFYPEIVSFFNDYEQQEIKRYEAALGYSMD